MNEKLLKNIEDEIKVQFDKKNVDFALSKFKDLIILFHDGEYSYLEIESEDDKKRTVDETVWKIKKNIGIFLIIREATIPEALMKNQDSQAVICDLVIDSENIEKELGQIKF